MWLIENKQQWQLNLWETENLGDTNKIIEQIALAPPTWDWSPTPLYIQIAIKRLHDLLRIFISFLLFFPWDFGRKQNLHIIDRLYINDMYIMVFFNLYFL